VAIQNNIYFIYLLSIEICKKDGPSTSIPAMYLTYVVQQYNMGDEKKKEIKIEKKDEFGNTIEEQEIEEKEED
jgi:hypothetical protein